MCPQPHLASLASPLVGSSCLGRSLTLGPRLLQHHSRAELGFSSNQIEGVALGFVELHNHGKGEGAQGDLHQHGGDQSLPQALYEDPGMLFVAGVQGGSRGGLEICLLIERVDQGMCLIPDKEKPRCLVSFKDMKGLIRAIKAS